MNSVCPKCGKTYPSGSNFCGVDGERLISSDVVDQSNSAINIGDKSIISGDLKTENNTNIENQLNVTDDTKTLVSCYHSGREILKQDSFTCRM